MTSPIAPDAAPSVPEFPALGDPSFNSKAYTWGTWIQTLVTWITDVVADTYQNALSAFESATSASASAASAEASSLASAGSSNFNGDWSALTGPLNRPASVAHAGRTWLLLQDLANVASATPADGSSYWRAYDLFLPLVAVAGTAQTAVAGYHYSLNNAAASTLTLPALPSEGAMVWVTVTNDRYDNVVARNGKTIMGLAEDMLLDNPGSYQLRFVNNSWRLV